MSRSPSPLPQRVSGRAFRVEEVPEVSSARLRAGDLWIPAQGVRLPTQFTDLESICQAILLTMPPSAAFSHETAARLLALPLPRRLIAPGRVHVTTPTGVRARRGRRIVGHERNLPADAVEVLRGVPVTTPARTFCDLAGALTLAELVALGDAAARMCGSEALRRAAEAVPRGRGPAKLGRAIELVDPGAESPKESELRVLLVEEGLGTLETNFELFDDEGRFVARVDLALTALRIAIEYEGDHHRDKEQWRRDLARRRRIEALGWVYIPVTQADLDDPRRLLADVRAAIARRR